MDPGTEHENAPLEPGPAEPPGVAPPRVIPAADHGIRPEDVDLNARRVLRRLREAGRLAYVAGGAVRDLLLGRTPKDFDVVTDARPEEIRRLFRNSRMIGRRFRIVHVLYGREFVEVSTFRSRVDPEEAAARHEGHVLRAQDGMMLRDNVYGTPGEDAWRRDFSVNALFYDSAGQTILDHVGGMEDLRAARLRMLGDPQERIIEDPVRMIRAVRFSAALGFSLDTAAEEAMDRCAGRLASASPARLYDEVQKLFFCGAAVRVLDSLVRHGLLDVLFPDMSAWARAGPDRVAWLRRVSRQVDIWRQAGHEVPVELFLALFFGPFHESKAGTAPPESLERTALGCWRKLSERVSVPRAAACHAARILSVQPRFLQVPPRRFNRFVASGSFRDAYIYFKLRARFLGERPEALAWWEASLGQGRGPETAAAPEPPRGGEAEARAHAAAR